MGKKIHVKFKDPEPIKDTEIQGPKNQTNEIGPSDIHKWVCWTLKFRKLVFEVLSFEGKKKKLVNCMVGLLVHQKSNYLFFYLIKI